MDKPSSFDMNRPAAAWENKAPGQPARRQSEPAKPAAIGPFTAVTRPRAAMQWPQVSPEAQRPTKDSRQVPSRSRIQGLTKNAALATVAFLTSAVAVLALFALIFARPTEVEQAPVTVAQILANGSRSDQSFQPGNDSPLAGLPDLTLSGIASELQPASLGSMRIPAIDLDVAFYPGVHDAAVALGPGLWPGTALPGTPGNSVFAGHRTTHTRPFDRIDRLEPGDLIETTLGTAEPTQFKVTSVRTVSEAGYVDYVLAPPEVPDASTITIFACAPRGSRTHRIVVRATSAPAATRAEEGGGA
ncbi:hypothetical protein BH23ACT12_BH23ACT12_23780 [soil metagenome]